MLRHRTKRWMAEKHQRDAQQIPEEDDEHQPFPRLETTGDRDADKQETGERYRNPGGDSEVLRTERDADELRGDREEVEHEQIADREASPDLSEPLEDEATMPDTGHRAEAHHHLLVHDEHRDEQYQGPEQAGSVVLSRRRIRRHTAGVVVADHHDEAGADDYREREEPATPGTRTGRVVLTDRPEGAVNVAVMCTVRDDSGAGRHLGGRLASLLLRQIGPPTVDDGKTERACPLRRSRVLRSLVAGRPVRCRDWDSRHRPCGSASLRCAVAV